MPPYRKTYKPKYKRRLAPKRTIAKRPVSSVRTIQAVVRRAIAMNNNRMIETKQSNYSSADGLEIFHNNFITLDSLLLTTTQGVQDPQTSTSNNRIGDKINLTGVSLKGMIELNERYSDVTIRILVVKSAKGDTPTRANLFNGLSNNKMLDTLNTERYTIVASKYIHMKAPNPGTTGGATGGIGSGLYGQDNGTIVLSRATKIWKMWIPGTKFSKSGVITYEDGAANVKFFDYNVVMYAYSNYGTLQDVYYVARSNDYVKTLFFKDA